MKNLTLMIATGAWIFGAVAHADYHCAVPGGQVKLTVDENNITRLGDTVATLQSGEEPASTLLGYMQSSGGALYIKKTMDLYPHTGDTLTIVTEPEFCGRGLCDLTSGPNITALLKMGETETYFTCHETPTP
ncbi:MAG: hypothetical protein AB7G93_23370 [Bdellovibrionales bacterium]